MSDITTLQNPYAKAPLEEDSPDPKSNYIEILEECIEIAKDRQEQYGNPKESMVVACEILQKAFGITLTMREMSLVLVALKFSRELQNHNEDNVKDALNYLAISLL